MSWDKVWLRLQERIDVIKNRDTNIVIFLSLWFLINLLFLDPLQRFVYLLIIGLFTLVVARPRFQTIMREHGSFQGYIDSLDSSDNYTHTVKELTKKFSRLEPSSAQIFLYNNEENITRES